jgi:hypothetical protein
VLREVDDRVGERIGAFVIVSMARSGVHPRVDR